uniref:Uncharacterized protein n=1 Tax=Plectus sambesii TaxID=2011161 RepID=A0A914XPV1_9BILA
MSPAFTVIALLFIVALVHSAPLTTSNNDHQSVDNVDKDVQSKVLNELKAAIEQKEAPKAVEKSNEATTAKPDTDAKDGNAAKESEKSIAHSSEPAQPSNIAMYIFETGNMDGFERALKELVDEKKMTAQQAAQLQESVLHEVEQMSEASLEALLEQQREAEAEASFQQLAEITGQLQSQAELRERLYDQVVELYGKQLILDDQLSAEALQAFVVALGESAAKGGLNDNIKNDLVDILEAALRDVKTVAEASEQKDDDEAELSKLVNTQ